MDQKLIDLLNEALSAEYQAAYQYLMHYNNVRGKFSNVIAHFSEHMVDEQAHANELASRIYIMGGTPTMEMKPIADYTDDVDEALRQDIVAEQEAIDLYSDILDHCEENKDHATCMMIEGILATEVKHIDEFAKLRRSTVIR